MSYDAFLYEQQHLIRPQYFDRQVVKDNDLNAAVRYSHDLMQRHQALLHGWGVVIGLEVAAEQRDDGKLCLTISPGTALSPQGETIVVCTAVEVEVSDCIGIPTEDCNDLTGNIPRDLLDEMRVYIGIRYDQKSCDPQPGLPDYCMGDPNYEYTRLKDDYQIGCLAKLPDSVTPEQLYRKEVFVRLINGFYPAPAELIHTLAAPAIQRLPESPWLVIASLVYQSGEQQWRVDYSERLEVLTQPRIQSLLGWAIGASLVLGHPDYRYQMYKDVAGEFRWRLLERITILADSGEGFETREECLAEIELMKLTARGAIVQDIRSDKSAEAVINGSYFQIYIDKAGEIRWRFKQGEYIIADSGEGYEVERRFWRDFHMVRRIVGGAPIQDRTHIPGSERKVREVEGIGEKTASRLARVGILGLVDLAVTDTRYLAEVLDISMVTADRYIANARALLTKG